MLDMWITDPDVKFAMRGEIERRRDYIVVKNDDSAAVVAYDDDECDWKPIDRGHWTGTRLRGFTYIPADWLSCWGSIMRGEGIVYADPVPEDEGNVFDPLPAPR
jgi:hypothetical protein